MYIDANVIDTIFEEAQGTLHNDVEVGGFWMCGWKLRQGGKLVDERAESFDGAENDVTARADDAWRLRRIAIDMSFDALGGESNRGERIFDFVGHPLRDFLPCELTLRLQELSYIFE